MPDSDSPPARAESLLLMPTINFTKGAVKNAKIATGHAATKAKVSACAAPTASGTKSPTINESEIRRYCTFRNLPDEVVRYMAKKREWIRHYQVKLNLVQNPKCPIDISMRFLMHLRTPDVRALERDKNIPQAVATAAKRLRQKRG